MSIATELIGTYCEAADEWYGTYKGIIRSEHKNYAEPRVNVEIIECINPPSDLPICCARGKNPYSVHYYREQYKPGEIHHFAVKDIVPLVG